MQKFPIRLLSKTQLSPDCWQFNYTKPADFFYQAGQYVLWEIPHLSPDNRGTKRLFTIASAPRENQIIFISKFSTPSSTFKQAMLVQDLDAENQISGPLGDFTLPVDKTIPLVFIASGVGCASFRPLLEEDRSRSITMLYANQFADNFPLLDYFRNQPINFFPFLTREEKSGFQTGYFAPDFFQKNIPNLNSCLYYLCGGVKMIQTTAKILADMGIDPKKIKRDIYTGYLDG